MSPASPWTGFARSGSACWRRSTIRPMRPTAGSAAADGVPGIAAAIHAASRPRDPVPRNRAEASSTLPRQSHQHRSQENFMLTIRNALPRLLAVISLFGIDRALASLRRQQLPTPPCEAAAAAAPNPLHDE